MRYLLFFCQILTIYARYNNTLRAGDIRHTKIKLYNRYGRNVQYNKIRSIRKGTEVFTDETKFFGLIKDHYVQAVGKVTTFIKMDNQLAIKHTFYIIQDDINIPNDGILGSHFLRTYGARINYLKNEIKFQTQINLLQHQMKDASTNTDLPEQNKNENINTEKRMLVMQEAMTENFAEFDNSQRSLDNKKIVKNVKNSKKISNKDFYKHFSINNLEIFPERALRILDENPKEKFIKTLNQFEILSVNENERNEMFFETDRMK